jgi:hypothetical protein
VPFSRGTGPDTDMKPLQAIVLGFAALGFIRLALPAAGATAPTRVASSAPAPRRRRLGADKI